MMDNSIFDEHGNLKRPKRIVSLDDSREIKEKHYGSNDEDGNLALKCTFNDKGYCGVCSQKVYDDNRADNRVWCNDSENRCREFVGKKLDEDYPCYESVLFLDWEFGSGVVRNGKRYGQSLRINFAKKGKLALLTTLQPFGRQKDRYIFGFLYIKEVMQDYNDPTVDGFDTTFIIGDPEKSLKINPAIKLNFWKFYQNAGNPELLKWGSGLFRYLDDEQVLSFLKRLKEEYVKLGTDERAVNIIDAHLRVYGGESPQK